MEDLYINNTAYTICCLLVLLFVIFQSILYSKFVVESLELYKYEKHIYIYCKHLNILLFADDEGNCKYSEPLRKVNIGKYTKLVKYTEKKAAIKELKKRTANNKNLMRFLCEVGVTRLYSICFL